MKKKISLLIVLAFIFTFGFKNFEAKAEVDFKKEYKYYEKICSAKSSFELNKNVCLDFENYKKNNDSKLDSMESSLSDKKMSSEKLIKLIQENNDLIEKKNKQIEENKKRVKENKIKAEKLEKNVLESLETMQYFSDQNQIVDIIMASSSVDDLMNRIEGMSSINKANIANIYELEQLSTSLISDENNLKSDVKKLENVKKEQEKMLREFRKTEAELYSGVDSSNSGAVLNSKLDKVDLSKINDKEKEWKRPLKSGVVTASSWYYPSDAGGGWHPGIDLATPVGSNILAPANGVLLATATGGSYGNHMVIATKKGGYVYTMIFAHMSEFVGVNEFNRGDVIGKTGNTGASTGPHVHVEIIRHNTDDLGIVIDAYKKNNDYWFGLGYDKTGDCSKVCRLKPADQFKLSMGQSF